MVQAIDHEVNVYDRQHTQVKTTVGAFEGIQWRVKVTFFSFTTQSKGTTTF